MRSAAAPRGAWRELGALEGRFAFLARRGAWFWLLVALGIAARAFLVVATQGTHDVAIWADHASGTAARGLVEQYRASQMLLNHPPLAVWAMAGLWKLALATGVDFRICMRAALGLADLANVALLASLLAGRRERWLVAGAYAVAPLALVLGAYHGNTDAAVATLLLGAALCASRGRIVACGALLGIGLAFKLPIVLGAPALGFALPTWRKRFALAAVALAVALAGYAPALAADFDLVREKVFGYRGLVIFALSDPPTFVWGLKNAFIELWGIDGRIEVRPWIRDGPHVWPGWALGLVEHGSTLALALIVAFAFLRRRESDARGLAATIALSYAIFYALVDAWAFQYFAWSMPFWLLGGRAFACASHAFAGGYIYLLYAFVCDDALLRGPWNFEGHPSWPGHLLFLREAALYTFVLFAALALVRAVRAELAQRAPSRTPRSAR